MDTFTAGRYSPHWMNEVDRGKTPDSLGDLRLNPGRQADRYNQPQETHTFMAAATHTGYRIVQIQLQLTLGVSTHRARTHQSSPSCKNQQSFMHVQAVLHAAKAVRSTEPKRQCGDPPVGKEASEDPDASHCEGCYNYARSILANPERP